jgi:sec-independent protein translocase protein TatA
MDFQGIGGGEILLILIVALLIWGPNRIIEIGRTLGKTVRTFKKAASDMTVKMEKELEDQKKEPPVGKIS